MTVIAIDLTQEERRVVARHLRYVHREHFHRTLQQEGYCHACGANWPCPSYRLANALDDFRAAFDMHADQAPQGICPQCGQGHPVTNIERYEWPPEIPDRLFVRWRCKPCDLHWTGYYKLEESALDEKEKVPWGAGLHRSE